MLRSVLRKDLVLNAPQLWGLPVWLVYAAYVVFREPDSVRLAAGGSAVMGAILASTIGAREDKLRVAATLASLPVRRRTLVKGRYITALVVGVATFMAVAAMAVIVPSAAPYAADEFRPNTVLVSLAMAAMAVALLMPIVVRFGLVGVLVFLATFQVLGALLFIALQLFGVRAFARIFHAAEQGIQSWHASLTRPLPVLETVVIVAIGVWLSFRLSVFLAERRDL